MLEHAAMDNRRQIHLVGETVTVLFIRQEICGQRQPTPRQHYDQTLLTEGTDQTVESHGREMADDRAQFQTEATVCGQESITGHLRSHLAVTQGEVRQDREHGFARGALDTPDGKTTQPDPDIMRVARQAPSTTTGRLVCELKADGQDEGEHTFDKGFTIAKQLKVGVLSQFLFEAI
jgi:hypothetical protein